VQQIPKMSYNIFNENVVVCSWSFEMKKIDLDLIAAVFLFVFLVLGAIQWFAIIKEADKIRNEIYDCQIIIDDFSQEGWNYCKQLQETNLNS
jgi:hypothetical protein